MYTYEIKNMIYYEWQIRKEQQTQHSNKTYQYRGHHAKKRNREIIDIHKGPFRQHSLPKVCITSSTELYCYLAAQPY